jgi:hypothetical protein
LPNTIKKKNKAKSNVPNERGSKNYFKKMRVGKIFKTFRVGCG